MLDNAAVIKEGFIFKIFYIPGVQVIVEESANRSLKVRKFPSEDAALMAGLCARQSTKAAQECQRDAVHRTDR